MTTTLEAVDALCAFLGFAKPRTRAVARALTDAGVLPAGGPGRSPEIKPEHLVSLLIGVAVDAPLRAVADAVRNYRELAPGGANLDGAPESIIRTAGEAIDVQAHLALGGDADLFRRDKLEIVSSWQEIALHDASAGKIVRFVPVGADASRWQASGHRRSTIINGAAFNDAVRSLFGGK
ncbi:hypothetical protein KEU06_13760 [Pseudaminobacter sp. 19-2017]|uniref:Uncharacterized protein n=1 Tax=Pseudaminobacter soli (ex Zhang et al. 2022) TaxID=2831468 RepID=A0A942DX48_9HYPH|nr:hypothetical protein [Pseudaminobacter soli]MBS3649674.1 hypothetical protein [Pseudaminobacter soli]